MCVVSYDVAGETQNEEDETSYDVQTIMTALTGVVVER